MIAAFVWYSFLLVVAAVGLSLAFFVGWLAAAIADAKKGDVL